jgi:coenzyme F420-0:L-glutamate ligase/coenzyme F420-1:gamma-L-glutamate ligase
MTPQCVQKTIFERRSIRRYTDQPVSREIINTLLNAAIQAPSAHNRQPWRFAVVTQPEAKDSLATAMGTRLQKERTADGDDPADIDRDVARSYTRLTGAPALIVLSTSMKDMDTYPDALRAHNEWVMATQSTAMAGQNLLLMAHALGLGACWVCAPLFVPDIVKTVLNLPGDWEPQGLLTLGYPAQSRQKSRAPLTEKTVYI